MGLGGTIYHGWVGHSSRQRLRQRAVGTRWPIRKENTQIITVQPTIYNAIFIVLAPPLDGPPDEGTNNQLKPTIRCQARDQTHWPMRDPSPSICALCTVCSKFTRLRS